MAGGKRKGTPRPPGSGRKKGTPNINPPAMKALRDSVMTVYWAIGGEAWLTRFAKMYPKEFVVLLARCMPHEVVGDKNSPLRVTLVDE